MEDKVQVEGRITQVLAGTMFRVRLENGREVLGTIGHKERKRSAFLTVGDKVTVEMPRSDPEEGQQPAIIRPRPHLPPDASARSG